HSKGLHTTSPERKAGTPGLHPTEPSLKTQSKTSATGSTRTSSTRQPSKAQQVTRLASAKGSDPLLQANGFGGASQDVNFNNSSGCCPQDVAPPDVSLAAGPNDIGEATNSYLYFLYRNSTLDNSYDISCEG